MKSEWKTSSKLKEKDVLLECDYVKIQLTQVVMSGLIKQREAIEVRIFNYTHFLLI